MSKKNYSKEYYLANKARSNETSKKYYEKNKERILAKYKENGYKIQREWREKNPDLVKKYREKAKIKFIEKFGEDGLREYWRKMKKKNREKKKSQVN